MLQRFFSRLDSLAAELGIFKVETIGASPVLARAPPATTRPRC